MPRRLSIRDIACSGHSGRTGACAVPISPAEPRWIAAPMWRRPELDRRHEISGIATRADASDGSLRTKDVSVPITRPK